MRRHNYNQMLDLYEQWRASRESRTEFALRHEIRPTTFYYWTKKFENGDQEKDVSGFHPIRVTASPDRTEGEMLAAVQYPSGVRLELYSSFQHLNDSYVRLLKTLTE